MKTTKERIKDLEEALCLVKHEDTKIAIQTEMNNLIAIENKNEAFKDAFKNPEAFEYYIRTYIKK